MSSPQSRSDDSQDGDRRPPGFWQVIMSVLAAMFGVQSERNRRRDFSAGRPLHYIVAGLVMTVVLVFAIWLVVQVMLRSAGL